MGQVWRAVLGRRAASRQTYSVAKHTRMVGFCAQTPLCKWPRRRSLGCQLGKGTVSGRLSTSGQAPGAGCSLAGLCLVAAVGLQGEGETSHEGRASLRWALYYPSCLSFAWPFPDSVIPRVPACMPRTPYEDMEGLGGRTCGRARVGEGGSAGRHTDPFAFTRGSHPRRRQRIPPPRYRFLPPLLPSFPGAPQAGLSDGKWVRGAQEDEAG